MYSPRLVQKDTYYVGASERRLALFENIYPLSDGVSYNSYLILDEKTCLLDTVDQSVQESFVEKVQETLKGRPLDYLVIQHMEPDHAGSLRRILELHPEVTLVLNNKTLLMFKNYLADLEWKKIEIVKELDTLTLGKHILNFVMAPMVHWPEVMVTYDSYTKTLFSADAFGTFGALSGNLFADRVKFEKKFEDEARRYYTNIVGKYGDQVQALLKKASLLNIETICPLHGPIWRQDLNYLLSLYDKWSRYEAEVQGVLIVYGSIYGHGEVAANIVADQLAELGLREIALYDASKTDKSYLVSEAFKYSHLVVIASTYNAGIFTPVKEFLEDLKEHNLKNRQFAVVENGSWAPMSGKLIEDFLKTLPGFQEIKEKITIKSAVKESDATLLKALAETIFASLARRKEDDNPLFKIPYGLFALSTFDGKKQNACIINTVMQVSSNPNQLLVTLNKQNYSASLLKKGSALNLSILTKHTPFSLIQRFGYQSGRDVDKFEAYSDFSIADNGVNYLNKYVNAYFELEVVEVFDFQSHFGYLLKIKKTRVLNNEESLTYDYYMNNIKPLPKVETKKKGWICKICGYIYEGEDLPADFICPICKHGASDFEKLS